MTKLMFYAFCYLFQMDALVVRSIDGELSHMEIPQNISFQEAMALLQGDQEYFEEPVVDFYAASSLTKRYTRSASASSGEKRDYFAPIKPSEKEDILYIATTLGLGSIGKIAKSKSDLKKAGERVDRVHPFNFLYIILSCDKGLACYHAIRDRSLVWGGFKDGVVGSLNDEAKLDNLQDEYLVDFAKKLNIDPGNIRPYIQNKDWNGFLKALAEHLPRQGDPSRYTM